MKKAILRILGIALVVGPAVVGFAQGKKPTAAYYITKEEVDTVNKTPGVDRTIKVMDIGDQHFSVGIIHRGATTAPAAPAARPAGAAPAAPAPGAEPCGETVAAASLPAGLSGGLYHAKQTEGYYIVSGEGKAEDIGESWNLAKVLGKAGVPNRVDSWGPDWPHDWITWRKMLPQILEQWLREGVR